MQISVVVPAYNEALRIEKYLLEIDQFFSSSDWAYEIIVVNDGSTDKTAKLVDSLIPKIKGLKLLDFKENNGKGYVVRKGILASTGEIVFFTDADGSTPIAEFDRLRVEIEAGYDVVIGSRAVVSDEIEREVKVYRKFLGRCFNFVVNSLLLPEFRDTQCGFKMFNRNAADQIFSKVESNRFSFDLEVLLVAKKMGLKIKEVAVNWTHVPGSKVNVIWDGIKMCRDILVFKFRHRRLTAK